MFDQEFIKQVAEQTATMTAAIMQRALVDRPVIEKRYLTIKDAATYTGYSVEALRACIKQQQFPVTGHGTTLRIDKKKLDDWMTGNTH